MPSYNFTDIEIEIPENVETASQLREAMNMFRKYGVRNGYVSVDGSELKKVVDGQIVEESNG